MKLFLLISLVSFSAMANLSIPSNCRRATLVESRTYTKQICAAYLSIRGANINLVNDVNCVRNSELLNCASSQGSDYLILRYQISRLRPNEPLVIEAQYDKRYKKVTGIFVGGGE